jgi:hypothetical protein
MGDFTTWAKRRGWWQTQRFSFWLSAAIEEYAGLEQGYWTVVWISRKRLTVEMLFSPEQKESCLKAAILKERRKSISRQGIVYNGGGIRRTTSEFWGSPKIEKAEESLQTILTLLHEVGIGPSPVCTSCGARDGLDCYRITHTLLSPYLLCPACVQKLKTGMDSGLYRYPRKAALVKGDLL